MENPEYWYRQVVKRVFRRQKKLERADRGTAVVRNAMNAVIHPLLRENSTCSIFGLSDAQVWWEPAYGLIPYEITIDPEGGSTIGYEGCLARFGDGFDLKLKAAYHYVSLERRKDTDEINKLRAMIALHYWLGSGIFDSLGAGVGANHDDDGDYEEYQPQIELYLGLGTAFRVTLGAIDRRNAKEPNGDEIEYYVTFGITDLAGRAYWWTTSQK